MTSPTLRNEYRRERCARPYRAASKAIAAARVAIAARRTTAAVYASCIPAANVGAAFRVGAYVCRWIERPADAGLREVGAADSVAPRSVRHKGWYLDDDAQDETARGAVFQLPARKGVPQFVAAVLDPFNDGPAIVAFDDITDDAVTAAHWADQLAERYAENEREYSRAANARAHFDDLHSDIVSNRREALALIAEAKESRGSFGPKVCATVRAAVESLLRDIRKARAKRDRLESTFAGNAGWNA